MRGPDIVTFGCRLNAQESEVMRGHAAAAGLHNAVIVNTCAVTAEAERQASQSIRRWRRERPDAKIIVTGCASHIDPEKFSDMPEVDFVIANDRKVKGDAFQELGCDPARAIPPPVGRKRENGDLQRAFVPVQNGCNHRCTFCIIPFGRGASRSIALEAIVAETRAAVADGYREVVFTGVDIASYGNDINETPPLGWMVREVLKSVPALPRLRLSSLDPAAIDEDLWSLIADEPRFMPHLHLSLQAGDDMVLKRMKRRHLRADVFALCERARRLRPDIAFGADVIAGFPTESEAMFQNTYDLIEQCGFTWLHVFPYSSRAGTPAAKMPQVNGALRQARAERLRALGAMAIERHMARLIGTTFDVLVEKQGVGCTRQFAKVKLIDEAPPGEIVTVAGVCCDNHQAVVRRI